MIYLLNISCGDALLGSDPISTPENNFQILWEEFDKFYALFDTKNIDWNTLYQIYRPQVSANTTDQELFGIMATMLAHLNDGHVNLIAPFKRFSANQNTLQPEGRFDFDQVRRTYLNNNAHQIGENRIVYGRIGLNIGYIFIRSFSGGNLNPGAWTEDIDIVLEELKNTSGIIIDIRNNPGGNALNSLAIAGRFVKEKKTVARTQTRNGPKHTDFTPLTEWSVEPKGPFQYTGPTAILTNNLSASTSELLVLELRQFPHITVIGDTTAGVLGNNIYRELPNGWAYRITTGKTFSPQGEIFDGIGIPPTIPVSQNPSDQLIQKDTVIETALKTLLQQ